MISHDPPATLWRGALHHGAATCLHTTTAGRTRTLGGDLRLSNVI